MLRRYLPVLALVIILALNALACDFELPTPTGGKTPIPTRTAAATPVPLAIEANQPVLLTGTFTYSNDFVVETYFVEQAVALNDMHGFVIRDNMWELPIESQVLGFLSVNADKNQGTYRLALPALPGGVMNDVDHDGQADAGVQIFAVTYAPNLTGGPFSEGDDVSRGWPSYLASVKTDTENKDEVTGGKLVVWAPDERQQFPTGFGADGLLFTADDPVGALPAGYSVIDLDQKPFGVLRQAEQALTLYEPQDVAVKDYSKLGWAEAFTTVLEQLRKEYAFTGIAGKSPDWDKLKADLLPRMQEAERKKDTAAHYQVWLDFSMAFKDGHVSMDGGSAGGKFLSQQLSGGYGLVVRELDKGKVIVTQVIAKGPAEKAGILRGAEVTRANNLPISEAIGKVAAWRFEQTRLLLRAPVGTDLSITYTNPQDSVPKTATLKAIRETDSYYASSLFGTPNPAELPVEFRILDSGAGYIRINSNYDDLNLLVRLFERALKTFRDNDVTGVVIDLRQNTGGAPLGLAGFLTDQEIGMGQLQYYSEKTGKFENEGDPEKVYPNQGQYRFDKLALLVGPACFSACELEAYGFSRLPGIKVLGYAPSAGVEAEVARGQFTLPEGISLQVPTGRFINPDGSLFLEGAGVQLTQRIPLTAESVLNGADVVLATAEKLVAP
jgi:C-terminal processing protease CtpA/Prc